MVTKKNNNQLLGVAAQAAIKLVQDPRVQEQMGQAAAVVAAKLKERARRSKPAPLAPGDASAQPKLGSAVDAVKGKFGNKKLERRVENLAENVKLLRSCVSGPEAAEALREVDDVVSKLEIAVSMAENLPVGKRQKAHWEIDKVLDDLERSVFASVMS